MIAENTDFHTAIFDALCACLNLSATEGLKLIHEAYAEPENTPRPPRSRNAIYWTILQDPASDPVSTEYESLSLRSTGTHTPVICTTLKYNLIIVCYGPASEAYAQRIRHMLYLDGAGFPRRILRDAGIFPLPDPPPVSILHEEEGSLWRKRADLTVSLRVRHEERGDARNSIALPATVTLYK